MSMGAITTLLHARRTIWSVGFVLVGGAIASSVVADANRSLIGLGFLGLALVSVAIGAVANWRMGVILFLGWMLIEDLPRKYLGNNMIVFFGKDALLALTYVGYLLENHRVPIARWRPPFLAALVAFIALGAVQVFNPASPSVWYGLMGMKLYFFYVPLVFLGFALLRDERDFERFLVAFAAAAGVIAVLGIAQGIIGLNFLNPKVLAPELEALGRELRRAPRSGVIFPRATSVFVSEARYGSYMVLAYIVIVGATMYAMHQRLRSRWLLGPLAILTFTAVAMHGSRAGVLYLALSTMVLVPAMLFGAGPDARRRLARGASLGLVGVAALPVLLLVMFPAEVGARWALYSETISPWSPESELRYRLWDYPMLNLQGAFEASYGVMGQGIGTASIGAQYVSMIFNAPVPPPPVESGFGTLLLEFGYFGPILWVLWSGALLLGGWHVLRQLRGTPAHAVGVSILWFAFLLLVPFTYGALNTYQNYLYNVMFWLFVGILYRLPTLASRTVAT